MVNVVISPQVAREIDQLPKPIRARMHRIIERLMQWPEVSGVKQLSGNLAGHCRVRTGDYRLQFRVSGEVFWVERVGHRDGFYEE